MRKYLTLSHKVNLRLFQTGRVADDNFKFDENGGEFFKRVENIVVKGKLIVARNFPILTMFSKDLYCRHLFGNKSKN